MNKEKECCDVCAPWKATSSHRCFKCPCHSQSSTPIEALVAEFKKKTEWEWMRPQDDVFDLYTAPTDEHFADMKAAATEIWNSYDDPYKSEKLARIKDVENIGDNFMYLFAMFDHLNQRKCADLLKIETRHEVRKRMIAGGQDDYYVFGDLGV